MKPVDDFKKDEALMSAIKRLYQPLAVQDVFADALYEKTSAIFLQQSSPARATGFSWFMRVGALAVILLAIWSGYATYQSEAPIPVVVDDNPTWQVADLLLPASANVLDGLGGGSEAGEVQDLAIRLPKDLPRQSTAFAYRGTEVPAAVLAFFGVNGGYDGGSYERVTDGYNFALYPNESWRTVTFARQTDSGIDNSCEASCTAEQITKQADAFLSQASLNIEQFSHSSLQKIEDNEWFVWYFIDTPSPINAVNRPSALVVIDNLGVREGWLEIFGSELVYTSVTLTAPERAITTAAAHLTPGMAWRIISTTDNPESHELLCSLSLTADLVSSQDEEMLFGPMYQIDCENEAQSFVVPAWEQ